MAYIDANVFVYAMTKDAKQSDACLDVLDLIVRGKMRATTSSLSWDEVVQAVAKTKGAREAAAAGEAFLAIPRLSLVPVDRKTLAAAQQVYAKYGLRPRDSIHAACAILEGEHEIYSVDSDFDRVKELKRREPR